MGSYINITHLILLLVDLMILVNFSKDCFIQLDAIRRRASLGVIYCSNSDTDTRITHLHANEK